MGYMIVEMPYLASFLSESGFTGFKDEQD